MNLKYALCKILFGHSWRDVKKDPWDMEMLAWSICMDNECLICGMTRGEKHYFPNRNVPPEDLIRNGHTEQHEYFYDELYEVINDSSETTM